MSMNPRYNGKPLLRLLELYVLHVLGDLSPDALEDLEAMGPYLGKTFDREGEWHEIIAAEMEFPANMPDLIVEMWDRNQKIALENNVELSPQQFTEMFVDQNLVPS